MKTENFDPKVNAEIMAEIEAALNAIESKRDSQQYEEAFKRYAWEFHQASFPDWPAPDAPNDPPVEPNDNDKSGFSRGV